MFISRKVEKLLTTILLEVIIIFLAQAVCTAHGYYSIHREFGKESWSFPKTRSPTYPERLALAGRVMNQDKKISQERATLERAAAEELTQLLRGIERFHSLSSKHSSSSFPNRLPFTENASEDNMMLDNLMASLSGLAENGTVSSRCINDTGYLLISMFQGQGWALKFLDANGKPGPGLSQFRFNFVGDYELCRSQVSNGSETFKGNYVTWTVALGPVDPVNANPLPSLMARLGVCMPDTCNENENTLFVKEAVQNLGLNGTLQVLQAEIHTPHREASAATIVAIVILCVIGMLMVVGTAYDVLFLQWPLWKVKGMSEEREKHANNFISNGENEPSMTGSPADDDEPLILQKNTQESCPTSTGKLVKVLLAFSVYTNGSKVLNTTQQPGSVSCIHGIRFFSMSWVILGHTFGFILTVVENVSSVVPSLLSRWSFDAISNAFVSVDTFFTLSGFLVSYLAVTEMKKRGWRLNWGLFYFHRFWRLTPPYMLAIVLVLGLQQYCGQGPLWESVQPSDKVYCEKYWWTNLLYINNLVYEDKPCFEHSWYLANDMQFFVVSPLMIIPFYFNTFLGASSCAIFFSVHVITTGVLSAQHKWGASMVTAGNNATSYFEDYYKVPWCRIGPYIVGIATGYLLAAKRDKVKFTWPTATFGWLVATAVALSTVYGLRGDLSGDHPSSVEVAALYNALARSAWAASVCWVIVACVSGWGGFVNSFLSWSPFVVLGRLTYMAYLIHLSFIAIYVGNQQSLIYATSFNLAMIFISIMVCTYGISFVLMLALESPMIGLEKIFLPQRRKD